MLKTVTLIPVAAMLLSGCVTSSTHDKALAQLAHTEAALEATKAEVTRIQGELQTARQEIAMLHGRNAELDAALAAKIDELGGCRAEIDAVTLRMDELGAIVETVSKGKKSCQRALSGTKALLDASSSEAQALKDRLEQLRAVEEEQRRRNEIYQDFIGRFRAMIDAGELTVAVERGRIVLKLPQDILFESGKAEVGEKGRETLAKIADGLARFEDRRFQVEGHTDNVPIKSARYPSNWELSSARSLAVVHLLVDSGVPARNLSAAGYGEFQPRAANDTDENKKRNRRIEIVMLPNLDILSSDVPGL